MSQLEVQFPFPLVGTQYWRAPTPPPEEWADDLGRIVALGLEVVQLRVQWAWHERVEGVLDFGDVVRLINLAADRGLRTVVKFMVTNAPHWLFANYEADRVAPSGQVIPAFARSSMYSGLNAPCFDRPLVRSKAENFIRELTRATCNHPSLAFYSLWNEIRSTPFGQCACPDSRRAFAAWLRQRYQTVDAMNVSLGKDFGTFEQFRPPAASDDFTSALIWRTWALGAACPLARMGQVDSPPGRAARPGGGACRHEQHDQCRAGRFNGRSPELIRRRHVWPFGRILGRRVSLL